MKSLLLRRPGFQIVALLLCAAIGISGGYLAGLQRSSRALARCQEQNAVLTNDLGYAVQRGVILETNLTLCKEHKNATTH